MGKKNITLTYHYHARSLSAGQEAVGTIPVTNPTENVGEVIRKEIAAMNEWPLKDTQIMSLSVIHSTEWGQP